MPKEKDTLSFEEPRFAEIYIESGEAEPPGQAAVSSAQIIPSASVVSAAQHAVLPNPAAPADPAAEERHRYFAEMRRLAHLVGYSRYSYEQLQAAIFYRQAKFMEDFEDDYRGNAVFSMYYPTYQSLSDEQLRTYFTWRSRVRRGEVLKTSYSYVFLYLYELINQVGAADSEDGLRRLLFFWEAYRRFEKDGGSEEKQGSRETKRTRGILDKYMSVWVRDYYITNAFSFSFSFDTLVRENPILQEFYPVAEAGGYYDRYLPISAYKFSRSVFYSGETEKTVRGCFDFVIRELVQCADERGADFDSLIFSGRSGDLWQPFPKALYASSAVRIPEGLTVRLSGEEIYRYENGCWRFFGKRTARENGRRLIGYVLKRIEQFYRKATGFPYAIRADRDRIDSVGLTGVFPDLEEFFIRVDTKIRDYYRLSNRREITVDARRLEEIRESALQTQEKLLADEQDSKAEEEAAGNGSIMPEKPASEPLWAHSVPKETIRSKERIVLAERLLSQEHFPAERTSPPKESACPSPDETDDDWKRLARLLTPAETAAVCLALKGAPIGELRAAARTGGAMLEVLVDVVNQKALDAVGDNIIELTDGVTVYEEYQEELERVMCVEYDEYLPCE